MKNYDCNSCTRPDCIHRDAYRRLPTDVGGLDLCPGHVEAKSITPDAEIITLVENLQEWEDILESAKEEVENIRDTLKREMDSRGVETLEAGTYIVRWTPILSSRFDVKRFKVEVGEDVYRRFCKEVVSRRFSIST